MADLRDRLRNMEAAYRDSAFLERMRASSPWKRLFGLHVHHSAKAEVYEQIVHDIQMVLRLNAMEGE